LFEVEVRIAIFLNVESLTNFNKFGRFSQSSANFSSEAGAVLTFFAYFFVSRQKSKSGFRGETPIGFYLCTLRIIF